MLQDHCIFCWRKKREDLVQYNMFQTLPIWENYLVVFVSTGIYPGIYSKIHYEICPEICHAINSSKVIGNFPTILNFNWLFLKLNRFICNQLPVLPDHWCQHVTNRLDLESLGSWPTLYPQKPPGHWTSSCWEHTRILTDRSYPKTFPDTDGVRFDSINQLPPVVKRHA